MSVLSQETRVKANSKFYEKGQSFLVSTTLYQTELEELNVSYCKKGFVKGYHRIR